VFAQLFVKMD